MKKAARYESEMKSKSRNKWIGVGAEANGW